MQTIIKKEYDILLKKLAQSYGRVFVITGRSSFKAMAASKKIIEHFKNNFTIFYSDIESNPSLECIQRAAKAAKEFSPQLIVAIGGGSVLDIAKSITYMHKSNREEIALLAIPTTSGTGSESTQFATYYQGKEKKSFDNEWLLPDYVILSAEFTENLPLEIIAQTGADAMCQAIESFWNVNSTTESKELAKQALVKIKHNITEAATTRSNKARQEMLEAANLSGKAINITRTTAAHSVSYPITSYFGVPHGQAVSVTLPYFLEFNYDVTDETCLDSRGSEYVKKTIMELCEIFEVDNVTDFKKSLISLFESIGLETSLIKLINIKDNEIDVIVKNGFNPSRMRNNPRSICAEQLYELLKLIN